MYQFLSPPQRIFLNTLFGPLLNISESLKVVLKLTTYYKSYSVNNFFIDGTYYPILLCERSVVAGVPKKCPLRNAPLAPIICCCLKEWPLILSYPKIGDGMVVLP